MPDQAEEFQSVGCDSAIVTADSATVTSDSAKHLGIGHVQPENAVTMARNGRSRSRGKRSHDRPEYADAPDQLYVADITYVPTWAGFLYLAVVLDVFSRRIVGWSMAGHMRTELVLDALEMAIWQRRPDGVIHHSDRGSQYTSVAFGNRCRQAGVRPSMSSVGDCYDNSMAESFFATLECELIDRTRFRNHTEARLAVFQFIEGWYNPHRRHSALGYASPINFERQYYAQTESRKPSTAAG